MTTDEATVVATWSGGIDSTAVIANLLARGRRVQSFSLGIYAKGAPLMARREEEARESLRPILDGLPGRLDHVECPEASWIWAFSPDGVEIPHRNRHIIDHAITTMMIPMGAYQLAMGEYIGADTWVVRDHVGAADADSRALAAYIYREWGLDYRLWTLADFGESRFKSDRVRLLAEGLGEQYAHFTTNCLRNAERHCGSCYKCVERHAAFVHALGHDATIYDTDPAKHRRFGTYRKQMEGIDVQAQHAEFGP